MISKISAPKFVTFEFAIVRISLPLAPYTVGFTHASSVYVLPRLKLVLYDIDRFDVPLKNSDCEPNFAIVVETGYVADVVMTFPAEDESRTLEFVDVSAFSRRVTFDQYGSNATDELRYPF